MARAVRIPVESVILSLANYFSGYWSGNYGEKHEMELGKKSMWSVNVKPAPIGEEVLAVFEGSAWHVWHAIQDEKGVWTGSCMDGDGEQTMAGNLICWNPWPKSPFNEDA